MSTVTIFDNEHAALWFHPEAGVVHHQFKTYMRDADFRNVLNQGLELLKQHAATKWLSDDRANSALGDEDTKWAQTDWFPRVLAAGWEYWAIVLPDNVIGQMNMKRFIDQYAEAGITVRVFSDPEEALDWLDAL